MSSTNEKKHLGYELLALVLFLGGAFLAVSGVMSLGADGDAGNPTTAAIGGLIELLGLVPFLGFSMAAAGLGAVLFLRPAPMALAMPLVLWLGLSLSASLLLGALGGWGGSIGGFLPGAAGAIVGGILGGLAAFLLATLSAWVAIGAPMPRKTQKPDQENPVAAALREVDEDGVTTAEAEALFPDPVPVAVAPGVREYEQRTRGELPDGVQVLDASDESQQVEDHGSPAPVAQGAAAGVELAEPAGADLAEAHAAEPVEAERADAGVQDGVWVRPIEADELTDTEVRPIEEAGLLRPSWERAEAVDELEEEVVAEAEEAEDDEEVEEEEAELEDEVVAEADEVEDDEDLEGEEAELEDGVVAEAAEVEDDEELEEEEAELEEGVALGYAADEFDDLAAVERREDANAPADAPAAAYADYDDADEGVSIAVESKSRKRKERAPRKGGAKAEAAPMPPAADMEAPVEHSAQDLGLLEPALAAQRPDLHDIWASAQSLLQQGNYVDSARLLIRLASVDPSHDVAVDAAVRAGRAWLAVGDVDYERAGPSAGAGGPWKGAPSDKVFMTPSPARPARSAAAPSRRGPPTAAWPAPAWHRC